MPLDTIGFGYRPESADESFKRRCIGWEIKRSLWPRFCYYTGKLLWLRKCYRGTSMLCGPGDIIFEYRWIDRKEFLFQKIRGNI